MTDRIWLVRHASTAWTGARWCGRADEALTAAGAEEARALARRLAIALPADIVLVSSAARRARATAEAIATALRVRPDVDPGLAVTIDDDLVEVDVGRAEGLTWSEVQERLPGLATAIERGAAEVDWPGGETAAALRLRVAGAWKRLMAVDRPVVVVSHGGVIRATLAAAGVAPMGGWWSIPPAGVIELSRASGGWTAR